MDKKRKPHPEAQRLKHKRRAFRRLREGLGRHHIDGLNELRNRYTNEVYMAYEVILRDASVFFDYDPVAQQWVGYEGFADEPNEFFAPTLTQVIQQYNMRRLLLVA